MIKSICYDILNMIKMKLNSGESPDIIDYNIPAIYDMIDPESNFAELTNESWVNNLLIRSNVTDGDFFAGSVLDVNPDANIGMFAMSMTPGVDYLTANISS